MKESREQINFENLLALIVLPRLLFADREEKGASAFNEGLLFFSDREEFCPVRVKLYLEDDLQEIFKNFVYEDCELLGEPGIKGAQPFQGYTAVIEFGNQEIKEEGEQQEIHLKSIKRFF